MERCGRHGDDRQRPRQGPATAGFAALTRARGRSTAAERPHLQQARAARGADPRAARAAELGFPLPDGFELTVVEERPDRLCFVRPVDVSAFDAEAVWTMTGVRPPTEAAREGEDVWRASPPPPEG